MVKVAVQISWLEAWVLRSSFLVYHPIYPSTRIRLSSDAVRLMRSATLFGVFEETASQEYKHTPFSEVYLKPEMRGYFKLM